MRRLRPRLVGSRRRTATTTRLRGGTVVAVLGTKGAPGSTECAASLAASSGSLLVELDAMGGALDLRLGGHSDGSVVELVRAASDGGVVGELLERWLVHAEGWPPALLGPPEFAFDWRELTAPGAVSEAIAALRPRFGSIVCDVGFLVTEDVTPGPAGHVHREALRSADRVVLVVGARTRQLAFGLAQLDMILGPVGLSRERVHVVVNGCGGPGALSRRAARSASAAVFAATGLAVEVWLPWDGRALEKTLGGRFPLVSARPRGPYARALEPLLDGIAARVTEASVHSCASM